MVGPTWAPHVSLTLLYSYKDTNLTDLSATPGLHFTEPQVKCFRAQILVGLHSCDDGSGTSSGTT